MSSWTIVVERKGDLVDRIEYHVEQSGNYVAQGQQELVQANKYMSKARKVFMTAGDDDGPKQDDRLLRLRFLSLTRD